MTNDFSEPRAYRPAEPFDASDPPKFGQLIETTKDAVASELRRFFNYKSSDMRAKIEEVPNIEKFAHYGTGSTEQSMETVINLIMSQADTPDRFPMLAITSASVKEKRLGIGGNFASAGQYAPSIMAANQGNFDLQSGWTLQLKTYPYANNPAMRTVSEISTILFDTVIFGDIHDASVDDVAAAINMQALYYHAATTPDGFLRIIAGGPAASGVPNSVEVIGGSPECLLALGLTVGQADTSENLENPPKQRYLMAADMIVNIDVVSDSLNTRTELADLVFDYFAFYMERQFFQIIGRSYQNPDLDPPEFYQLVLRGEFSWSGEYQTPRAGGDQREQIYSIRGSVPLTAIDFINRDVNRGILTWVNPENVVSSQDLPPGDYYNVHQVDMEE